MSQTALPSPSPSIAGTAAHIDNRANGIVASVDGRTASREAHPVGHSAERATELRVLA